MSRVPQQPTEPQGFLDATGAVVDIGALAVAVSAITDGAGALDPERTCAVYVLSCMAVAAWRQLDAFVEAGVVRDVRELK